MLNPSTLLPSPCLLVDLPAVDRNIASAASVAAGATLRPHFKAHKCTTLMRRQLSADSCVGVTCATADELATLAEAGFDDLLLANEVADRRGLETLMKAAARARVAVCIDDTRHVALLAEATAQADCRLGIVIEVDVGAHRCGIEAGSHLLVELAAEVSARPRLVLDGIMGFEGHAVFEQDPIRRQSLVPAATGVLTAERRRLEEAGHKVRIVSGGGTGTLEMAAATGALTEIQAGSYVLMDARYGELGLPFENAVFCRSTVLSRHGDRAVLDAGLKSLSAEYGPPRPLRCDLEILQLSDEHAQIRLRGAEPLEVGDAVLLVPMHLDPTVNLHPSLFAIDATGAAAEWRVDGRR